MRSKVKESHSMLVSPDMIKAEAVRYYGQNASSAQLVRTVEVSSKAKSQHGRQANHSLWYDIFLITAQIHFDIVLLSLLILKVWAYLRKLTWFGVRSLYIHWRLRLQRSRICKRLKEEGLRNLVLFMPKNAWPQLTNHNHTECQFRSFSTLTKAPDLDPMKQKKADVMGLRKSPRGVKPHPHTPLCPPPLPLFLPLHFCPKFHPLSNLQTPLKRSPPLVTTQIWPLWSQSSAGLKLFFFLEHFSF